MADELITSAKLKKLDVALGKIDRIHQCVSPSVGRVSTPGFEPTFEVPGTMVIVCETCRLMVIEAFEKATGVAPVVTLKD